MFRQLLQAVGRGLFEPGIIQGELRNTLGAEYANEFKALTENRLKEESVRKRAAGIGALGRVIVQTRSKFNDAERHKFLWSEVAKPGIDVRFNASLSGDYDPARFYVDAIDYAAAVGNLSTFMQEGEQSVAMQMIDTLQDLNVKFIESTGYFGNTPYWTLHNYPLWRMTDRKFTSVQIYWMVLLLADKITADVSRGWAKALLAANLQEIASLSLEQREQIFGHGLPTVASILSSGAVIQASLKNPESSRSHALRQIASSVGEGQLYVLNTLSVDNSMKSIRALKSIFDDEHPIQVLPDMDFSLAIMINAATMHAILAIPIIKEICEMPYDVDVFTNPRENFPHLLNASM